MIMLITIIITIIIIIVHTNNNNYYYHYDSNICVYIYIYIYTHTYIMSIIICRHDLLPGDLQGASGSLQPLQLRAVLLGPLHRAGRPASAPRLHRHGHGPAGRRCGAPRHGPPGALVRGCPVLPAALERLHQLRAAGGDGLQRLRPWRVHR